MEGHIGNTEFLKINIGGGHVDFCIVALCKHHGTATVTAHTNQLGGGAVFLVIYIAGTDIVTVYPVIGEDFVPS